MEADGHGASSPASSILLGQDELGGGLKHLGDQPDGRTTIKDLAGVPCRYLNRNKSGLGYFCFEVDPSFKSVEMTAATIEVEYFDGAPGVLKLQYDAMQGDQHHAYEYATPVVRMPGSKEGREFMGLVALIAFWGVAIRLWMVDGPRIPVVFIALWTVGFFAFPMLHWSGYSFVAFECILAVILLIAERYKSMT